MANKEEIYPYKLARLADRNGDLSKRWYINYYVWDIQKNLLLRKQYIDSELNKIKGVKARREHGLKLVETINGYFKSGAHLDRNAPNIEKEKQAGRMLKDSVKTGFEIKRTRLKHNSINSYSSVVKIFLDYLDVNNKDDLLLNDWGKAECVSFVDYLLGEKKVSRITANKYTDYLKAIFSMLEEREFIDHNPWVKIKKLKTAKSLRNIAFSDKELEQLIPKIKSKDIELWYFVCIMYSTFMRPNEIRQLKVNIFCYKESEFF